MPTWGALVEELNHPDNLLPDGRPYHDRIRRKYLAALSQHTGRATIVYSTGFLDRESAAMSIELGDLQGFMNAVANVPQRELDLVITSPGGSPEATESIVGYLRTRFDHIRAFVPVAAMSAATMLALGCDEIVMGAHSQLGPIDPSSRSTRLTGHAALPARRSLSNSNGPRTSAGLTRRTSRRGCQFSGRTFRAC